MFITLTNVKTGVPVKLTRPIDNRSGGKKVALHEIMYKVTWYNISGDKDNNWVMINNTKHSVEDGYYDFCTLEKELFAPVGITASLNHASLIATLTIPKTRELERTLEFPRNLLQMLGIEVVQSPPRLGEIKTNTYKGKRPIDMDVNSILFVHVRELKTSHNLFNDHCSDLLRILPPSDASFCKIHMPTFRTLQFKDLEEGCHEFLNIDLKNQFGKSVDCLFDITLEIVP